MKVAVLLISIMKSLVAIKPSYTTDGVVTYGTAGWSRMLDEKHVGDGPNSVPETQGSISFRLRLLWQHLR